MRCRQRFCINLATTPTLLVNLAYRKHDEPVEVSPSR